jgi:hypothetical protein
LIKDKYEVPTPDDDNNLYYYIMVELNQGIKVERLINALLKYCLPIEIEKGKFEKAIKENLGPTITCSIEKST